MLVPALTAVSTLGYTSNGGSVVVISNTDRRSWTDATLFVKGGRCCVP